MQTRYFKSEHAARFYARNLPEGAFTIERDGTPGPHPLYRLSFETPAELLAARYQPRRDVLTPASELARLKSENAEMRRTLARLSDALENHTSYKANFINLMVRNARALIGA